MTEIVVNMIKEVDLALTRIHNDSTTVKAYGKIPGKTNTGLKLSRGTSKDHRLRFEAVSIQFEYFF